MQHNSNEKAIEKKDSTLQFTEPRIVRVLFTVNKEFVPSKYKDMGTDISILNEPIKDDVLRIVLSIHIGKGKKTHPFSLELDVEADFKWENGTPKNQIEYMIHHNCVALLLSYARPYITHLTVDAGFEPFTLPYVDLRD